MPLGMHMTLECCENNESFNPLQDSLLKNRKHVAELLNGIQPPKQLAITKISGHSKSDTIEARGNQLINVAAKQAALNTILSSLENGHYSL